MKKVIAFDVDGTLIKGNSLYTGRFEQVDWVIDMLKRLKRNNHIVVWSGGGIAYAKQVISELKLEDYVDEFRAKDASSEDTVDLCFDDMDVNLATVNIKV